MATLTIPRKNLPVTRPQTINLGDDWIGTTFRHWNPNKTPVNLTGATFVCKLWLPNGTVIYPEVVVAALEGSYYPTLPDTVTATLPVGMGRYQLRLTDSLGRKTTYWAGPVEFKKTLPDPAV
jgi:hypothetical protein